MGKKGTATVIKKPAGGAGMGPFLILALALFVFWLVLSGKFEFKYMTIGFFAALGVAVVTKPLLMVPHRADKNSLQFAYDMPYIKLMAYFPWIVWQIVLANIQVVKIILNPSLPIQPQLVSFRKRLPGPVAYLILANSITLTPGTITVELENDEYLIHAIDDSAAESLAPEKGEGEMPQKVGEVFAKGD